MVVALALVAGCDPGEREARPYAGRWESEGFGLFLDVHGGDIDVYEHSSVHCLQVATGSARGISDVMALEGPRLVLRDGGRVVVFEEVEALPVRCAGSPDAGPAGVFAAAVATIAENGYPPPDDAWREDVAGLAATLGVGTGDDDLHAALVSALSLIGDPEFRLAAGGVLPAWPEPPDVASRLEEVWDSVWGGRALTGEAAPGVAYLAFLRLVVGGEGEQRDLAAALDEALAGADAVVVDLRAASGGVEEAALQVATRFVTARRVVARLEARRGDGVVPAGELSVTPLPTGTFAGDVVVLVGPDTSGPGELLARILADLPGVTIVGEATAGSPREPLVRALPNGWSLGVPNLEVTGPDGTPWVGNPLVPDIMAPTTADDLAGGRDPGLEAALATLG